jgi:bifunctional non-homologous end joining protein LigD
MARPIKPSLMVPVFSKFSPIIPVRHPDIFGSSDWVYEIKYDGFRALAYLDEGRCRFGRRKGNEMKKFDYLSTAIRKELKIKNALFDGEIVAMDESGMPAFYHLLRRKCHASYFAFDLLWLNREDLRDLPLLERKKILQSILPRKSSWIGYVNFIAHARAKRLFELVKVKDLEGLVVKKKDEKYNSSPVHEETKAPAVLPCGGLNRSYGVIGDCRMLRSTSGG